MSQEPYFTSPVGVMAVILMIPVSFLWLERRTGWKIFGYLPAIIRIFPSNLGLVRPDCT